MRQKLIGVLLVIVVVGIWIGTIIFTTDKKENHNAKETLLAETFLQNYLLEDGGRMHTDLLGQQNIYLSETVGLWMDYLVEKNDRIQFDQQVNALQKYFITKDFLVTWEVRGTKKAPANAFIDDLRIVNALYSAGEKWEKAAYTKLADKISKSLVKHQTRGHLMVDFVELDSKAKGSDVTVSYIIPDGFDRLKQHGHLPNETYEATKGVLIEAPYSSLGLFPKTYHVETGEFSFDREVNLIDQFYIGYHRAQWDGDVAPLVDFAKNAFASGNGGILYGRYDGVTGKPAVSYEAVAVYALAILMCLEIDETDFARELYSRMKTLQQDDVNSPYYGGYIDIASKDTHTFDNLLALIAERKGIDEDVF